MAANSDSYMVFGASGFGREVMPLLRSQLVNRTAGAEAPSPNLAFVDDRPPQPLLNGLPVMTFDAWLAQSARHRYAAIAVADGAIRERIAGRCVEAGIEFISLRAANVVELDDVSIGAGAILCPFVTLTSNVRIGNHFHANIYSYVAHDCVIGDYVTFGPGVHCNGNVRVDDHAYIGTGAVIRQGRPGAPLVIGRGAVVGMGAVVTRDVPPGTTVVGNPARRLEPRL